MCCSCYRQRQYLLPRDMARNQRNSWQPNSRIRKGHRVNQQTLYVASAAQELPVVELVSVNVAEPEIIGTFRGQPITSGIAKQPVMQEALRLDWLNLEGDRQADLRVHGGRNKAVYAYPSEHIARWNAELEPETP